MILFTRVSIGLALYILIALAAHAEFPKAFVGAPETRDVSISPDGQSVALLNTGHYHGIQQVASWDEIEIKSTSSGDRSFLRDEDEWLYSSVHWAFDDAIIANGANYTWSRFSGTKVQPQLIVIDPTSGETRVLRKGRRVDTKKDIRLPKIIGIDSRTRTILVIAPSGSGYELVSINVDTGKSNRLDRASERVQTWFLNQQMQPVIKVVRNRAGSIDHYYRRVGRKWRKFFDHDVLGNDFIPVSQAGDNNTYYVIARPHGAERTGLHIFDLEQGIFTDAVYEHTQFDLASAYTDSFDQAPAYAAHWADHYAKKWFDPEFETIGAAIDQALGDGINWSLLETTQDNQTWLIYVSSPIHPGDYYVFRAEDESLNPISRPRVGIDPDEMSVPTKVHYQARDGMALFGYFTPSRSGDTSSPLIVIPHGGPVARDTPDWDGWAQYFSFRGYAVFQPQFRGSGGFGLAFEQAGFGKWGQEMQWDIYDGVTALVEGGYLDATASRSIVGASYGGYASLMAATTAPDQFSCAVSLNGVSSLNTMLAQYDTSDPVEQYVKSIWEQRFGVPDKTPMHLKKVSPIAHVEALKTSVLLLHGEDDEIVPFEQSLQFAEQAWAAGIDVKLVELEGVGHRNYSDDVNTEILIYINRFLQRCMPPR